MGEEKFDKLEAVWEAYRKATPAPEPGPNFMPELWARIDRARPVDWVGSLQWLAARIIPAAAALTLAMGVYSWTSPRRTESATEGSYVDTLTSNMMDEQQPALWLASAEDSRANQQEQRK